MFPFLCVGIVEPIKAGPRDAKLGVGKQEQDDFYTAEENIHRKKLEVEVEETEEQAKKREVCFNFLHFQEPYVPWQYVCLTHVEVSVYTHRKVVALLICRHGLHSDLFNMSFSKMKLWNILHPGYTIIDCNTLATHANYVKVIFWEPQAVTLKRFGCN